MLLKDSNIPRKTVLWTQLPCPDGLSGVLTTTGEGAVQEQKGRKGANTTFLEPEVERDVPL